MAAEKEEKRIEQEAKLRELEKILVELEQQFGKDFVRRVVPQNKGTRCAACHKQMLFRHVVPVTGEHALSAADYSALASSEPSRTCDGVDEVLSRAAKHAKAVMLGGEGENDPLLLKTWGVHSSSSQKSSSSGKIHRTLMATTGGGPLESVVEEEARNDEEGTRSPSSPYLPGGARNNSSPERLNLAQRAEQRKKTGKLFSQQSAGENFSEKSSPRSSQLPQLVTLRKVDAFLADKRAAEKEAAREAALSLRTRKREVGKLSAPLLDETWGRFVGKTADLTDLRGRVNRSLCKQGWR